MNLPWHWNLNVEAVVTRSGKSYQVKKGTVSRKSAHIIIEVRKSGCINLIYRCYIMGI